MGFYSYWEGLYDGTEAFWSTVKDTFASETSEYNYAPTNSGGRMLCFPCQEFERVCVAHLASPQPPTATETPFTIKLRDSFQELIDSATSGCHLCRCWARCLTYECSTPKAVEELRRSKQNVIATAPFTATSQLSIAHFFKIRSTVEIDMRLGLISDREFESLMNRDQEISASRAKGWLTQCHRRHEMCSEMGDSTILPTRLLHIGPQRPRIIDGSSLSSASYIALSYCWGGDHDLKLTSGGEGELRTGVDLAKFSRTIQDAIVFCRELGMNFLWVDALCILQGGDSNEWITEASNIHRIYGNAYATLSICSASSASEGFRTAPWPEQLHIDPKRAKLVDLLPVPLRKTLSRVRTDGPLASRGWIFQEELLSPRIIYWSNQGLFWSCSMTIHAENGTSQKDELFPHINEPEALDPHEFRRTTDPLGLWDDMISTFSVRDFTHENDRLPAVSGLASLITQSTGETYAFGLWKSSLPGQLLWFVLASDKRARRCTSTALVDITTTVDVAPPSWSWANIPPGRRIVMSKQTSSRAVFLRWVHQKDSCRLDLTGRVRHLTSGLERLPEFPAGHAVHNGQLRFSSLRSQPNVLAVDEDRRLILICLDWKRPILISVDDEVPSSLENLFCFEISYIGLLLLQQINVRGEPLYRRIGCAQSHRESTFFATAQEVDIVLI